jgi:hypothetical protein
LELRKRAMSESGAKRPIGVDYAIVFGRLVRQHGFGDIARTSRWAIMRVTECLPLIEAELASLPDTERIELNSPQLIWAWYSKLSRGKRERKQTPVRGYQKRMRMTAFNRLMDAIDEGGNTYEMALRICKALGYSPPRRALKDAEERPSSHRMVYPAALPWSPFSLSL